MDSAKTGKRRENDAETVLRGAHGKLNACYDKEHAKNAALAGRVIFRLSIDDRGRVPLRDLEFPPSSTGGESTLTFPVVFGR